MSLAVSILRLASTVLCTALAVTAAAATDPRAAAGRVADAIEEHYYDAQRAAEVAQALRTAAADGRFDALTDPRDLATALTDRLRPADAHFGVKWSDPAAAPAATSAAPAVPVSQAESERRGNYGIQRVEVLPGNVGYLDLRMLAGFEFGEPDQPAREAIEAALRLLARTDAMILDLRANPGGSPAMVGYLTSAFTTRGQDVFNTFHGRGGRTLSEAPLDWYPTPRPDIPLYVLTSGRTGSAAEAVAYTLQQSRRAIVVGQTTIGAANPGGEIDVGDGFRVFVSVATPINPLSHDNWESRGVVPDIAVEPDLAPERAQREALQAIVGRRPDAVRARWVLEALQAADAAHTVDASAYAGRYGEVTIAAEAGQLVLRRDRRPALRLLPLGGDRFSVIGEPTRRIGFDRDAAGTIVALENSVAEGPSVRHRRDAAPDAAPDRDARPSRS
jgi:hypothetical protein